MKLACLILLSSACLVGQDAAEKRPEDKPSENAAIESLKKRLGALSGMKLGRVLVIPRTSFGATGSPKRECVVPIPNAIKPGDPLASRMPVQVPAPPRSAEITPGLPVCGER